jgi:hypothetical protein
MRGTGTMMIMAESITIIERGRAWLGGRVLDRPYTRWHEMNRLAALGWTAEAAVPTLAVVRLMAVWRRHPGPAWRRWA